MNNQQVPENHLQLGRLGKTFQLAGGLRFYPLGRAEAEAIYALDRVFIEGIGETQIRDFKESSGDIIIFLSAALSLEKAKPLVNKEVYAFANSLPEPQEAHFYIDELLDLDVYLDNELIGTVETITEAGLQDILTIITQTGSFMVPLQADYLNLQEDGVYLSNIPEGLLELND